MSPAPLTRTRTSWHTTVCPFVGHTRCPPGARTSEADSPRDMRLPAPRSWRDGRAPPTMIDALASLPRAGEHKTPPRRGQGSHECSSCTPCLASIPSGHGEGTVDRPDLVRPRWLAAQAVAKPQVENLLKGFNGCCFAYGQTGSGEPPRRASEGGSARCAARARGLQQDGGRPTPLISDGVPREARIKTLSLQRRAHGGSEDPEPCHEIHARCRPCSCEPVVATRLRRGKRAHVLASSPGDWTLRHRRAPLVNPVRPRPSARREDVQHVWARGGERSRHHSQVHGGDLRPTGETIQGAPNSFVPLPSNPTRRHVQADGVRVQSRSRYIGARGKQCVLSLERCRRSSPNVVLQPAAPRQESGEASDVALELSGFHRRCAP